jgi:hypothetical protein
MKLFVSRQLKALPKQAVLNTLCLSLSSLLDCELPECHSETLVAVFKSHKNYWILWGTTNLFFLIQGTVILVCYLHLIFDANRLIIFNIAVIHPGYLQADWPFSTTFAGEVAPNCLTDSCHCEGVPETKAHFHQKVHFCESFEPSSRTRSPCQHRADSGFWGDEGDWSTKSSKWISLEFRLE